jgi:tetratricopeptide (TPR) repeat protein
MAKKRGKKRALRKGSRATAAYRSEEYVMYIAHAEIGICEAWMMRPSLTDGTVESTLRWLTGQLERSTDWPDLPSMEAASEDSALKLDKVTDRDLIAWRVLDQLVNAQMEHGRCPNRDLAGCLRVIQKSIDVWTRGPASRGYLTYNHDFVTNQLGVHIEMVTEEGEVISPLDDLPVEDEKRGIDLDASPLKEVGAYLLEQPRDEEAQQTFAYRIMSQIAKGETATLTDLCIDLLNKARDKELRAVLLFCLGQLQVKDGRLEQAIQSLRRSVTADSGYLAPWLALGDAYQANEQPRDAAHAYREALRMFPDHFPTYDRLVAACRAAADNSAVVNVLRQQVAQFPQHLAPRYDLAQALYQLDERETAAATRPAGFLGKLLARKQNPDQEAEQALKKVRNMAPTAESPLADWVVWVRLRLEAGEAAKVTARLERLRQEQPELTSAALILEAVALELSGQSSEAVSRWQEIAEHDPELGIICATVRDRLGDLLPDDSALTVRLTDGDKHAVEAFITPAPEKEAAAATSWPTWQDIREADRLNEEAFHKLAAGKTKAAERLFQQAHNLVKGDASLYGMGLVHAVCGREEKAYEIFEEVVTIVDDDSDYWFNLGMAAMRLLRIGRALQAFERCLAVGGLEPELRREVRKYIRLLRKDVAENQREWNSKLPLEEYVRLEELFHQGCDRMEAGEITMAIELFREAILTNERHHQSWGNLGVCLLQRGNFTEAKAALQQALTLKPDYEIAQNNLASLKKQQADDSLGPPLVVMTERPRPAKKPGLISRGGKE